MPDGRIIQQGLPAPVIEHYPDSDGQPMADNDRHYPALQSIRGLLETRYRHHDDVCVTGDLLLYYQRYDASQSLAPDVMVVLGIWRHERHSYRLWEDGRPPDMVVEVSSSDSFQRDREEKRDLYGELGVREYFLIGTRARRGRIVSIVRHARPAMPPLTEHWRSLENSAPSAPLTNRAPRAHRCRAG